jgi:predicted ATPase
MTMHSLLGSSSTPPLVGRADELRRLDDALGRVAAGQGCARFLIGEAGIGKTRLARELLARARARGFRVLEARAYPLDGGLAYALFVDAFGPYLRGLDPVRQSTLVSGLNYLGRLFGHLRLPPPEPLGDAALEKTRLFEAVARLVERMATEEALVLFFDDLNWADPASLELLHYLARGLASQSILLLGAYRAEEAEAARGLRRIQL